MIEPEALSDRDYTTQQTADLCGISINTLLSWERRYGVPNPSRNDRGERVYRQEDLREIHALQAETASGVPIREAARHLREGNAPPPTGTPAADDVVVALDITPSIDPAPRALPPIATRETSGQRDLLVAIERFDRSSVTAILSRLALESDPVLVAGAVVLPAVERLAAKVALGDADPASLTVATRWLAARLSQWLDLINPTPLAARDIVVVVPAGTETAEIAALNLALRLARNGHHVLDLPPDASVETIILVARSANADRIHLAVPSNGSGRSMETRAALLRDLLPASVLVVVMPLEDAPSSSEDAPLSPSAPGRVVGSNHDATSPQ